MNGGKARIPRLVVFDLDGTLIDSIGDIATSANESLVEAYGESARLSREVVRGFVGGGARQLIERCLEAVGRPQGETARVFERFLAAYGSRLTETTRLYPGMEETLDTLASSVKLAVLTNKPGAMSRAIVDQLGLAHRFVAVVGGDDLASKKPDPQGLLGIAAQANVPPEEVALVGDSAVDIQTARNAGAIAVGVLWGYDVPGVQRERPDHMVQTPPDLMGLIRKRP